MAGTVLANGDDENTRKALEGINKPVVTFGLSHGNDWYADNIVHSVTPEFDIFHKGEHFAHIRLGVYGEHNIPNAVAACAAAYMSGATSGEIEAGLESFTGAKRRFDKYGEVNGITVCDDYGHHPTELTVTLNAAVKAGYSSVWLVFQPFTFSRTAMLIDEFAEAMKIPDHCVITAIMGSREKNTYGIYDRDLAAKVPGSICFEEQDHDKNFELCAQYVADNAKSGDLILTMGCGDINKCSWLILDKLKEKYAVTSNG
jgi:UDP-N-acetylmuramate--alanine ligase